MLRSKLDVGRWTVNVSLEKFATPSVCVLLTLLLLVAVSWAQDYERIAPKTLPTREGAVDLPPSAPPISEEDARVLVQELRGLVCVTSPEKVRKEGVADATGIQVGDLEILRDPDFEKRIKPFLGQPVSKHSLNQLTREIILYYREHDRPVVDVVVPEQDITAGVVQFVILEGKLGQVRVEGNRWFEARALYDVIRLRPGEVVREKKLANDLQWLNSNPFRQVNVALTPGQTRGETDILLKTKDRFPVRVYTGFEDTGNDLTNDERIVEGINWGDAFFLGQQINYQFTADPHCHNLTAHSGSWLIPLPWRHRLSFFGSYVESKADIDNPLFNMEGVSWQASGRYGIPLPSVGNYTHEGTLGFDFKQSNNDLEFGGAQVTNTATEIAQWIFGYSSAFRDPFGTTSLDTTAAFSPGDWTPRNKDFNFNASRQFADAAYLYQRITLERLTRLPSDVTWLVRGTYQWASGNLLGSEQLGVGGYTSVRGYDEREANGDEGYLFTTEFRSPPVSLGKLMTLSKATDQLQFLAFFDYGCTENLRLLPGEDPHVLLASVGPGLRYSIAPYLTFRFDYGWQLYDTGLNTRYNSRGHLGLVLAY